MATPYKRALVTPDKHFPYADMPAIGAVCKAIEIVKPTIYIDLGDTGEWRISLIGSGKRRKSHLWN